MSGTAEVVVQAGHVHGDVVVSPGPEHLDIEVSCEPAEIEAMPNQLDLIYPWMDSERARLHALADGYDWSQNKRSLDFLDHQHEVRQGDIRDLRTREVYESYIEDYLAQAAEVLQQRALLHLENHEPACVQLVVSNPTDLHFRGVELRVWFEDSVRGLSDDLRYTLPLEWPRLPPVPAPPGTRAKDVFKHQLVMSPPQRIREVTREAAEAKGVEVLNGWSGRDLQSGFLVSVDKFSLRPGDERLLPAVPLKVLMLPNTTLTGRWDATADSARGRCSGDLELDVLSSTANLAEIAQPGPPSENNGSVMDVLLATATAFLGHVRRPTDSR